MLGIVDLLGTRSALGRDIEKGKSRIERFARLCERWALEGTSVYPDDAQIFSDSLVVTWRGAELTPYAPLLELATLYLFASFDNLDTPDDPLWIRGALVHGEEQLVPFGKRSEKKEDEANRQVFLRNYALAGLKVALAEKSEPGNRLYIDSELVRGHSELEINAVRMTCVLPWPLPETQYIDVLWPNAAPANNSSKLLPHWIRICCDLEQTAPTSLALPHGWSTLAMITRAVFQRTCFCKDDFENERDKRILRFIVWAARCAAVSSDQTGEKFIEICRELPREFTLEVAELFDADRLRLASDVASGSEYARGELGVELPWETRGVEV